MKVVAYGLKTHEKIWLAKVTLKQHDITIIANDLCLDTVNYAAGKDALVLTDFNNLTVQLLKIISEYGISLIITWNATVNAYLSEAAKRYGIGLVHLFSQKSEIVADIHQAKKDENALRRLAFETILALNSWPEQKYNNSSNKINGAAGNPTPPFIQ